MGGIDPGCEHRYSSVCFARFPQIGSWPRSRAVYGLDVLLAHSEPHKCSAQLLEVNFCPDFTSLLRFEPQIVNDIFEALFSRRAVADCFWRLKDDADEPDTEPGLKDLNEID